MSDACVRYRPVDHVDGAQCVVQGKHLPTCCDCPCTCHSHAERGSEDYIHSVPGGCYEYHKTVTCTGCLPARAEFGVLCRRDHYRLLDLLGAREGDQEGDRHGLVWMHELMRASIGDRRRSPGKDDSKKTKAESAPLTWNVDAMDMSNDMEAHLKDHIEVACALLGRHGPQKPTVRLMVTWMLNTVDQIENLDWVKDLFDDLVQLSRRAHSIQPWTGGAKRYVGIMCPLCETVGDVWRPNGESNPRCAACATEFTVERHWTAWLTENAAHVREFNQKKIKEMA